MSWKVMEFKELKRVLALVHDSHIYFYDKEKIFSVLSGSFAVAHCFSQLADFTHSS